jgi:type IV pilus assembly protein PilM
MVQKASAIDVGSHSVRVAQVKQTKHGLALTGFFAALADEAATALRDCGVPLKGAVAGLAGRDMNLRYTQVPPSPDWQLRNLMELEIADMASQSGGSLSADYNLLPVADEDSGMETVLLAFAKDEALTRSATLAASAAGSIDAHVPNCIALYNAYVRLGPVEEDATVCVVNLGRETIDLAIVKGVDLLFVRNLSNGGKVFDDAIAQAFNVSERKAEALKKELLDLDPFSRGRYASGQAEKVTMAAGGAGSSIVAAIQSSLAFCRSQTKNPSLALDRVLICGGTSKVKGIAGMMREALRCPVEPFDPFERVDLSELSDAESELLAQYRSESVIVLGLAAGRVDDSLYQLEILPENVKRKRRFLQRTVWNIGAGVVAAGAIAVVGLREKDRAEIAETALSKLNVQQRRLTAVDNDATTLVEKATAETAVVDALAERAVPHDSLLLTLRAIARTKPEEIWIHKIEVKREAQRGGSTSTTRPVVVVVGKGKDVAGRGVTDAYNRFLSGFKAFRYGDVTPSVTAKLDQQDGQGNTSFTWTIDYRTTSATEN